MTTSDDVHKWNGTTYRTILAAAETGGAISVIYGEAGPFNGPPAHIRAAGHSSLRKIAAELTARGIRTRRGGQWGVGNVRALLWVVDPPQA